VSESFTRRATAGTAELGAPHKKRREEIFYPFFLGRGGWFVFIVLNQLMQHSVGCLWHYP
jgi:hypothetical protein